VLTHSILRQASGPVSFTPINRRNIPEFTRGMEDGSTDFSFSRFLTPWLSGYEGISVFMDCDMLVMCDIYELLDYWDNKHAVFACHHDYTPSTATKFLGNTQSNYPKKNWSSLMMFNNDQCRELTPEKVNTAGGAWLHQFKWANHCGSIPIKYNHLVGEYHPRLDARIAHFTLGTPCFKDYEMQEFSAHWFAERDLMLAHD